MVEFCLYKYVLKVLFFDFVLMFENNGWLKVFKSILYIKKERKRKKEDKKKLVKIVFVILVFW